MREIGTWFGLPDAADGPADLTVLGCPFDGAATGPGGSATGPEALRHWSSTEEAIDETGVPVRGLTVRDAGDVPAGEDVLAAIRSRAARILEAGPTTVVGLGGDHAVTIALAEAVARHHPEMAYVMLDAHADCFPDYEGDPESHACTVARLWERGATAPDRTALVGLRSFATPELAALASTALVIPAAEWRRTGSPMVAQRVVELVGSRPVYLSIDIDVLDPAAAPGTGYPVAGGPSSGELLDVLGALVPRIDVVGLDLVEVAPPLDPTGVTAAAGAHLLLQVFAAIAARRRGQSGG
jgi:agmatinase